MIIDDGVYSKRTAQEVASGLHHLIKHPEVGFIRLDVRHERRSSGASPISAKEQTLWVKLVEPPDEIVTELANGGEIVRAVTKEGRRVDVFIGKPAERNFVPALVLLAAE